MTNQEFCKIYSSYYGERLDHIDQIKLWSADGDELKELIEFYVQELNQNKKFMYPKWVNNFVYFLAGIGFAGIFINYLF